MTAFERTLKVASRVVSYHIQTCDLAFTDHFRVWVCVCVCVCVCVFDHVTTQILPASPAPQAVLDAGYCYSHRDVAWSVCLCVGHDRKPRKNKWIACELVCGVDTYQSINHAFLEWSK